MSAPDRAVRDRHVRHNVLALGADLALFLVGLSFASQATILPAFALHLGAPSVVIGAIPAVMQTGWLLPALFAAGHTEALGRKLPFVLRWTVWERVPFVALALGAFLLAERAPGAALALLLGMLLVITGVGGALLPAWMDIVGRAVPLPIRGRFFALSSVAGNLGGLGGSAATAWILATLAPPGSYGVCFLAAALFMALSWAALAATREPPPAAPAPPRPALGAYLRRVGGILRRHRNLREFVLARAVAAAGTMAGAFFTVYALRAHGAAEWQVGVFTSALLAGQIAATLVLGWVADRAGHRRVILIGAAATAGASLVALATPSLALFGLVFALQGVQFAVVNVSGLAVWLEFAPSPGEQPTYVGLGSTLLAPVAVAAPLLGGLLVDTVGFGPVFALSALAGLGAVGLLAVRVRDPRAGGAG